MTEFDKELDKMISIALNNATWALPSVRGAVPVNREMLNNLKKELIESVKENIKDNLLGDYDETPPTDEWLMWTPEQRQFLIGRNNRLMVQLEELYPIKNTCLSIDCPERKGGECTA